MFEEREFIGSALMAIGGILFGILFIAYLIEIIGIAATFALLGAISFIAGASLSVRIKK